MNLAERIKAAQEALAAKKDALSVVLKELEDTPDNEETLAKCDGLSADVESATKSLESLERAEKALAERAKTAPAVVHSQGNQEDQKDLWAKQATVAFLSHVKRQSPDQVRQELYSKNKALEAVMTQKSAVPLANTYTAGWAQELVQSDVRGFINILTPTSVAAALSQKAIQLDFGGFDSVTIPRRNQRSATNSLGGAFVGEGGAIPLGRLSVGSSTLSRYKQAVISTFSQELAERSTPAIESVIRQAILDDTSVTLDSVFLGTAAAVTGIQPAGLMNGVTPITGTTGGGVDAVVADIKALVTAMMNANLGSRPVLIINAIDALSLGLMQNALGDFVFRDELNGGRLLGIEVIKSMNVTAKTAILVDASTIATAFDSPSFNVSDVATVVEANADGTAPTMANGGASGAVGTAGQVPRGAGIGVNGTTGTASTGYTARSLWQTYSVGVRSVIPVSWGLAAPGGVVAASTLTW